VDCAQSPNPNPQSPIPNPQSPILTKISKKIILFDFNKVNNNIKINKNKIIKQNFVFLKE